MTNFWTVFTGVAVFILGQFLVMIALEPVKSLRKLIGEIAYALGYYGNQLYGGPKEKEARDTYRDQSCKLRGVAEELPPFLYCFAALFRLVPPKKKLLQASSALIGLSNAQQGDGSGTECRKEIVGCLRISGF